MNRTTTLNQAFDIIGDIHGHATELEALLVQMGYNEKLGHFSHPAGRKVVFLGDYIDRGPEIRRVLEIVRGMMDAGEAYGIMGNHEVNALLYHQLGEDGAPLRENENGNKKQHQETLDQVVNLDPEFWQDTLKWFRSLPMWLDLGGVRVVHACWSEVDLAIVANERPLGDEPLTDLQLCLIAGKKIGEFGGAVERLLSGPELTLPEGQTFEAAGKERKEVRFRWWVDCEGLNSREVIFPEDPNLKSFIIDQDSGIPPFPSEAPITFFGHYAVKETTPQSLLPNLACLDYGMGKGGQLVAYSWDGESDLNESKLTLAPVKIG